MTENIKKFEPKFESITEVNKLLKGKDIDLRKTIEKVLSKDIGINPDCMVEVEDYGVDFDDWNVDLFSDEFYNKLEELKNEGTWIYIRAVYANTDNGGYSKNIYGYEIDDKINEDEIDDYYVTVGIDSCVRECDLKLSSEYYTGDITSDYGIMVEDGKIRFQLYTGGFGSSIDPICNLSEPLHALSIEIMLDIIEFKD